MVSNEIPHSRFPINEEKLHYYEKEQVLEYAIDTYGKQLTSFAFTFIKDWGKAEDIVQDVFLSLFQHFGSFRGEASIKTWLYQVTRNRCIDELRSWSFKNLVFSFKGAELKSPQLSPEQSILVEDAKLDLSRKVLALPVKYREMLILHYYEGFTITEISKLTNTNYDTVKTRLARAKERLKKAYRKGDKNG